MWMYTYTETQETLQHMTYTYVDDIITKSNYRLVLYITINFSSMVRHIFVHIPILANHIPYETKSPNWDNDVLAEWRSR